MKILNYKNISWNILKTLSSLNFSIILLLLIALVSILGTIIEQDQSLLYYQTSYPILKNKFYPFNWHTIIFFGLDHLYANWWFLWIIFLFFVSLIICTFSRQLPALKNARNWKFLQQTKNMKKIKTFQSFSFASISNMIYSLNSCSYYVFHRGYSVYAYKGLLGRIAPIFVHLSIILTLIGTIMGLFGGFMVQEMVPNGETFHLNNVIKSGVQSRLPYNLVGLINDFSIQYNQDSSIQQFFSSVSIMSYEGKTLITKQISVNSPLIFNGITFYQTDWQVNALRFRLGQAPIMQKKLNTIQIGNKTIWFCNLPVSSKEGINIVITGLKGELFLYDSNGMLLKTCNVNQRVEIYNTSFIVKEIMASTGLQIKVDPGISVVYLGFFILIISVITSYLSYSQIWVKSAVDNMDLAGSTNRAVLAFEEDFIAIRTVYTHHTFQ
uniref:Cytochrome c biogenesis protein CcsB n=1 Tax=Phyllymenia taiwanensis TaxID=1260292 RepID=R9XWB1_9FLOR|nr:cytochrome c biogenesis protein ccs1 [Grateloupia taiwanensis]AGO19752.1 cytochrome c biogenesis protein ccs1 [Grateloupia taiwanensis]